MNLKNYLTPAQVKAYATTPKKALEISIKHWWQNTQLTRVQLVDVTGEVSARFCGLCVFYKELCSDCILTANRCSRDDGSFYRQALTARDTFLVKRTEANYLAFIKAAKNMHKCLCELEKEQ